MSEVNRTKAQFFRFLLVSSVSLLIDSSVYLLLSAALGVDSSWAKRVSFACIVVWGFFANKRFTFRQQQVQASEPVKFGLLYLAGWTLNSLVHDMTAAGSGASTIAFLAATATWALLNFTGQKWFVFSRGKMLAEKL